MTDVIQYVLHSLDTDLDRIQASLQRLSTEQVWNRLRHSTNSAGNLCLHLTGAEYQRISSAIGGKPLIRERTLEFTTDGGLSPDELLRRLHSVRTESKLILNQLPQDELEREIPMYFQPEDWRRMYEHVPNYSAHPSYSSQKISLILLGLVAHYSYHTGQIVMLAKSLQDGHEQILEWKH